MNRCRHRGSAVCQYEKGNASFFRCPYHGWTYRNTGELVGATFPDGYDASFAKEGHDLNSVPRVASYQGFVFGSMATEGESLEDFLGNARPLFDLVIKESPTGKILVTAGCQKTVFKGNWKYVGMDGYHINFVHKSVNGLNRRKSMGARAAVGAENSFSANSPNRTMDLGNGHVRLDTAVNTGINYDELIAPRLATEAGREYVASLENAYGKDQVRDILVTARDPHLGVWPNLQLINGQIRVIRPLAADLTEVYVYPTLLGDVPEDLNSERLRRLEWFYGPASFGQPDDSEIFERNQVGLQCEVDPWVLLARGLAREKILDDGTIVGHISDEVTQRGQMRAWLRFMQRSEEGQ
jgi:phenylpropionate dioxygenase-like ring-hydroxylating dioxygenase large terminal subunit